MKEKILICYVDVREIDYKNTGQLIDDMTIEFSKITEDKFYFIPIRGEMEIKFLYDTELYNNEIEINKIKINAIINKILPNSL